MLKCGYSTLGESEMSDCNYQSTLLLDGTTFLYFHDVMFLAAKWSIFVFRGSCNGRQQAVLSKILLHSLFFQLDLFWLMFCLCNAAVGYPEAASTTTLSQRRQTIIKPLNATSMTSRKPSPLTTGNRVLVVPHTVNPGLFCKEKNTLAIPD